MSYTVWSVVFGEQPTAAKWNQLGENDAGFKDGTNIDALAITNAKLASGIDSAKLSNPHKFTAKRTSTQAVTANTWTKVQLNAEDFDTGNNFDSSTNYQFTAPIAGFYLFSGFVSPQAVSTNPVKVGINVNSFSSNPTHYVGYSPGNGQSSPYGLTVLLQLAANDTVQLYAYAASTSFFVPMYLMGHLVSAT